MKRFFSMLAVMLMFTGCAKSDNCLQEGMHLRELLLANNCSFVADICANYGDKTYTFSVGCTADCNGDLRFVVISPESIAGISGKLTDEKGFLTFNETILAFPMLAEGEVSPVSAPWLLMKTLRGGYITSAGLDGSETVLTIHDSYEEESLQLDIRLNDAGYPYFADILWQGRNVLSITVKDFSIV